MKDFKKENKITSVRNVCNIATLSFVLGFELSVMSLNLFIKRYSNIPVSVVICMIAVLWIICEIKHIYKTKIDNSAFQLSEEWTEHNLSIEEVYDKQDELNKQGWFTVIKNEDDNVDMYKIIVYRKER